MTQLKEGGCQPRDWEEHLSSASTVIARWQGMAGTSRVNREVYARFCGRLEVKSLRPTRQSASQAQRFLSAHAIDLRPLPSAASPDSSDRLPVIAVRGLQRLAAGDVRSPHSMRPRIQFVWLRATHPTLR